MIRDLFNKARFGARRWWQRLIEPEVTTGGIQGCLRGRFPSAATMAVQYPTATLADQISNASVLTSYPTARINGRFPSAAMMVSDWEC